MPLNRDELKKVFDQLDTDGDDQVDFFELKNAKAALANLGVTLSLKELKQVFISADKDGDTAISFDEFCDAVERLPATLNNRQQSMKALQDVMAGKAPAEEKEEQQCSIM